MVLPPRSRTMYFAPDSFPAKKNLLLSVDSKCISWQYIEADSGSNAINNWSLFIPAYKKNQFSLHESGYCGKTA